MPSTSTAIVAALEVSVRTIAVNVVVGVRLVENIGVAVTAYSAEENEVIKLNATRPGPTSTTLVMLYALTAVPTTSAFAHALAAEG